MNDLYTEIGYKSINKYGEQLCGDHVDVVSQGERSTVIVLADGMGSGVKASILSTLTAKIISTMMAESLSIEECVATVAATLPVCAVRQVAYSTFTILRIVDNKEAEIIQYDNPDVILLREGKNYEYPREVVTIGGKTIYKTRVPLYKGDVFLAVSDGAIHAGVGRSLNFGWERKEIIQLAENFYHVGFTARTLAAILIEQCNELYGFKPGDDTTVCAVKIRERAPVNLVIGPPASREDCNKMMSLFFSKAGKHIVCGGTTSAIASQYLKKPLLSDLSYPDPEIPPTARLEGADLVSEGVVTINKVLEYAADYLGENKYYEHWGYQKDGASRIARMLLEEATDINFYVGMAVNPAHQAAGLPISFSIKMQLIDKLADCLKKLGKKIIVSYF